MRTGLGTRGAVGASGLDGWCRLEFEGTPIWVRPDDPDWFVPDTRADVILTRLAVDGSVEEAAEAYAERFGVDQGRARLDTSAFLERLPRRQPRPLMPRAERLSLEGLRECWLHLTNRCNQRCVHCLFAASPESADELSAEMVLSVVREARALGARIFYATGGEPLIHPGFGDLCREIADRPDEHLVTLTNAEAVSRLRPLADELPTERFHFQISLDGPEPVHDAIRGTGAYRRLVRRVDEFRGMGFPVTLAMVVDRSNVAHMPELVSEAARYDVGSVHFMWYFAKGRGAADRIPPTDGLFDGLRAAEERGRRLGVRIDNLEIIQGQVLSLPGTRYDLSNAGWQSLAVGPDGSVYPTAALVLEPDLRCGNVDDGLEHVWRTAGPLQALRSASVADDPVESSRPLVLMTGGGDVDHSFVAGGRFVGCDPYIELHERTALWMIARQAGAENGSERPGLRARMGERLEACSEEDAVAAFTHSNCVLSLPGDDSGLPVRQFYAQAAERPNEDILNPFELDDSVPEAARSRSYGCGSPVLDAALQPGETVVDLGCGAGAECCVAARSVGRDGRVIGVDQLAEMLRVADGAAEETAEKLGHRTIDLVRGDLHRLPLADGAADVVISNCVINLSTNKRRTFEEIVRVLRPGGRLVVADVCRDVDLPLELQYSERLRGECLGGAFRQEELIGLLEDVGFEGIRILRRVPYRKVRGYQFHSLTYAATVPGADVRRTTIYRGPFAGVVTEDGRVVRRGRTMELPLPEGTGVDESIFVLDEDGAVTNVDVGEGCACFVAPEQGDQAPSQRITDVEGCMVCGQPLEYTETAREMVCEYCGRALPTSTVCAGGHFVCDRCHGEDAAAAIESICLAAKETDLVDLFLKVREHPAISVHGPEYHALVPAVIVAVARNSGLELGDEYVRTAVQRGRTIVGGSCGFMGACGAALGVGTAFAVILGSNPYAAEKRKLLHAVTICALQRIGELEAARCCQRDCWLALREAADRSEEVIGVRLGAAGEIVCRQLSQNSECYGADCPLHPAERGTSTRAPGPSLRVVPSHRES